MRRLRECSTTRSNAGSGEEDRRKPLAGVGLIRRVVIVVALVAVLGPAPSLASGSSASDAALAQCGTQLPVASYAHVIVIMDENLSWPYNAKNGGGLYQSPWAPFINGLISQCRTYEAAGATDPSQANYMAATQGYFSMTTSGAACMQCFSSSDNLFHQFDVAGLSWHAYEETMPAACSGSTQFPYKKGHNPAFWYDDLTKPRKGLGGDGSCAKYDTPYSGTSLDVPLTDGSTGLPAFSWVTPNVCDDMHWAASGCPPPAGTSTPTTARIAAGDSWLDDFLTNHVFNRPDYKDGSTLILLTWDEGNESGTTSGINCADTNTWPQYGSCDIATILISPSMSGGWVNHASVTSPLFSHYSILQLVEHNFSLPTLATPSPAPNYWASYTGAPLFPTN